MKNKNNNSGNLNIGVLTALILYGFALYIVPLQSTSFYFDDHASIESNEAIRTIDLPKIFNAFNTRFLVGLSFALNYKWCGLHPAGYRFINLLIHCLNAFLVYLLVKSTLHLYTARKAMFFCPLEWPAFFASMLFLCHPIQTEPVNFITQRFVLMGSFFYLLTLFLYIQYRCQSKKIYLMASMASAVAATFCKEFVVTLPLMLTLYDFYFLGVLAGPWWKRCSRILPFFAIALIVPVLLLKTPPEAIGVARIADSHFIQKSNTQRIKGYTDITRARDSIGRQQYFLTELHVMCTYIRLLFLPINQNFDYDYSISHEMDAKTLMSGIFLLGFLTLAVVMYGSNRIISFSIVWFFIALSVESSVIPIGHVIAEYRLYLASVGFVFLITALIYTRKMDLKGLNIIAAIILIVFSVLTYQRNKVWKSELSLWNDTVQKSPHKARPYYSRGLVYYSHGHLTQALSDYNKALEISPDYAEVYDDRGVIYYRRHQFSQALADYNRAIEMGPNNAMAYYNRGIAYYNQGNLTQAMSDYNKAIKINPDYTEAYINRGIVYYEQGKLTQALSDYNRAIKIDPNNAEAYYNRGITYYNQDNLTQAMFDDNKAIEINPKYAQAYDNRGIVYYKQGKLTKALSDYNRAIEIDPKLVEAYIDQGVFYDHQGKLSQAISDDNKAIAIDPKMAKTYNYRGLVYYKQGNYTKALSDYNKAIEIDPRNAQVYNDRGSLYGNQGDVTQAMSNFDKAIEINPAYIDAYNNRAAGYYALKKYDKAWADVRKAEELGAVVNPNFINELKQALGKGK